MFFTEFTLMALIPWFTFLTDTSFYVTVTTMTVRTGNCAVRTVKSRLWATFKSKRNDKDRVCKAKITKYVLKCILYATLVSDNQILHVCQLFAVCIYLCVLQNIFCIFRYQHSKVCLYFFFNFSSYFPYIVKISPKTSTSQSSLKA